MTHSFDVAMADAFWEAQRRGTHFPESWHDRLSFEQGYRIQLATMTRQVSAGGTLAGWKVAQTSNAGRKAFGFDEPVFGFLMQEYVRHSGHVYNRHDLMRARCEPEICVRLKSDLAGTVDTEAVRQAVGMVYPAFEIIEVRGDIVAQKALAIADNAATKEIVLGEGAPFDQDADLASIRCRLWVNADQATHGTGADVMGDPLNAIVWLAGKLSLFGHRLRAGQLIMTGSLTSPVPFLPGDQACAELTSLGTVSVSQAFD